MKKILTLTLLFTFVTISSFSDIINGWEKEAINVDVKIEVLQKTIAESTNKKYIKSLKAELDKLKFIKEFYDKTQKLLDDFKEISPELYSLMDTLKDAKNRKVDVYVKLVHIFEMPSTIDGFTNLNTSSTDKDQHNSDYGENTIFLKIKDNKKAIYTLAHEFGHAHYQIKNLSSYIKFFVETYDDYEVEFGHKKGDLSGVEAEKFEKIFEKHEKEYRKRKKLI